MLTASNSPLPYRIGMRPLRLSSRTSFFFDFTGAQCALFYFLHLQYPKLGMRVTSNEG